MGIYYIGMLFPYSLLRTSTSGAVAVFCCVGLFFVFLVQVRLLVFCIVVIPCHSLPFPSAVVLGLLGFLGFPQGSM